MTRKTSCAFAIALILTAAAAATRPAAGGAPQTSAYTFAAIATTATPIPEGTGTFTFQVAGAPAIDNGNVAFVGQGPDDQRGVYLWSGGALQRIADTTMALPTPDTRVQDPIFTNFVPGSTSINGSTIAFGASGSGTLVNGATLLIQGLYASEAVGGPSGPVRQIRNIVQANHTDLPGVLTGGEFKSVSSPSVGDGVIAFNGEGRFQGSVTPFFGIYLDTGGSLSVLADTVTDVPNQPPGLVNVHFDAFGPPSVDGTEIAFQGAFFDRRLFSIYSTVGGLHSIARSGHGAPDASGAFSGFLYGVVSSPVLDGEEITFLSTLENNITGNFAGTAVFTTAGGTVHAVVTSRDDTPDRDSIFHTFSDPSASAGHLAFLATGLDGVEALYTNFGGTLHRVIGVGDVLNGATISELRFGKEGLSGDTLAFFATLDDGSSGIFTATREELDATPPEIDAVISPAPNAAGWNTTSPTVTWSVQDPESGIVTSAGCAATTVSDDTAARVMTCSATNGDGLQNSKSVTVKLDTVAPSIAGSRAPLSNPNGWTNGAVTVSFTCSDAGAGIASCASSTVVSTEGFAQSVTGTAVDVAGNVATAVVGGINIDVTPPSIAIAQPPDGATFALNQAAPAASYTCSDTGSGVASCTGPVPSGAAINTATPGVHSLTVNALDLAGNPATLTHHYTVRYAFDGFLSPLNNLPTTNRGPAGRTYPVKWILRDGTGAYIGDPAAISGVTLVPGSCSGATAEVAGEDTAVQLSGLRFDPATGIWHFNWQTQKSQVGCWSLQVRLADGSVHAIAFDLR